MIDCFAKYDGQISTGFHSTVCLMNELTRFGRVDEAYRLITNREMPSWGYAIDHGATTIWERWDGYVEGRGFQNPGMNSFAHYGLGSGRASGCTARSWVSTLTRTSRPTGGSSSAHSPATP